MNYDIPDDDDRYVWAEAASGESATPDTVTLCCQNIRFPVILLDGGVPAPLSLSTPTSASIVSLVFV